MTLSIMSVAILFAVLCILLPGWGLKQILVARGFKFRSDTASELICFFSLGVHINAVLFLCCWVFVSPNNPLLLAAFLVAVNVAVTVVGWLHVKSRRPTLNTPVLVATVIGGLTGLFAAFHFPSALDSVQVLQVQNYLLGRTGGQMIAGGPASSLLNFLFGGLEVPTQSGFAGLILIPSLLQTYMPVATIAAANKFMLLILAAVVSLYAARQFKVKFIFVGAGLIFLNMVFSKFGLYGLFATGKDSIFSMLMALAAVAAVVNSDDDGNEAGLFMSAAILLGAISVPYLLVFWALYFFFSGGSALPKAARLAAWSIYPLVLAVVGVRAAFAEPGHFGFGLLPFFIVALLGVWTMNALAPRVSRYAFQFRGGALTFFALLPTVCLIGIWFIMPVTGQIVMGYNEAGPVTVSHAPLDGVTSAAEFLMLMYPMNNLWISISAVILSAVAPLVSRNFRSPFYLALFSFLPATLLFALLNVKLGLTILPHFNLWDISRDTVQWCIGVFAVVIVLSGVTALRERFPIVTVQPAAIVAVLFFVGLYWSTGDFRSALARPPLVTQTGGFSDRFSAIAMDFTWREGRDSAVFVSRDTEFARDFFSYQMFGPAQIHYYDEPNQAAFPEKLYFASARDLGLILKEAATDRASGFVHVVSNNEYVVKLLDDGMGNIDLSELPETITKISGAYDVELAGDQGFRWVQQSAELTVMNYVDPGHMHCSDLGFVNGWGNENLRIRLTGNGLDQDIAIPQGADFVSPLMVKVCVQADEMGVGKIDLLANTAARQFPNDGRNISYGILWPID